MHTRNDEARQTKNGVLPAEPKPPIAIPTTSFTLAVLLPLLALAACTKTIPVELDTYEERVAIESLLLPGTTPKVYLNKTVPFFNTNQTPSDLFLPGADVTISSRKQDSCEEVAAELSKVGTAIALRIRMTAMPELALVPWSNGVWSVSTGM